MKNNAPPTWRALAVIAALLMALAPGCATSAAGGDALPNVEVTAQDRLQRLRTALRIKEESPFAQDSLPMLEEARAWVSRADALMARPPDERDALPLVLDALEGQLVVIQARYSRLEAEADLKARQATYEDAIERRDTYRQAIQDANSQEGNP